jgi:hypothetical protein
LPLDNGFNRRCNLKYMLIGMTSDREVLNQQQSFVSMMPPQIFSGRNSCAAVAPQPFASHTQIGIDLDAAANEASAFSDAINRQQLFAVPHSARHEQSISGLDVM